MRRLLTLILLLLPTLLWAQEITVINDTMASGGGMITTANNNITATQVRYIDDIPAHRSIDYRHNFRIGAAATGASLFYYLINTFDSYFFVDNETMSDLLAKHRFTYGEKRLTPVMSVGYSVKINNWFGLGVSGSATSVYRNRIHAITGERHGRVSLTALTAILNAHFQWYHGDIVQMYSSFGLGVLSSFGIAHETFLFYDATWVGLSVGKGFYGYFELGGGASGVARCGLGYRF